ncbi:MAG: integrase arm-type DNA-binding domain-containing protein [Desulfovibrio sp.]|nr:integrase arm-type DNA-binding domain-containing protein [Desulfovibrio sp.]
MTWKLTDKVVRAAQPKDKPYKLSDGMGMYLEVQPNGRKWWRWKYRFQGKEKRMSLGVFPETSLSDARRRCLEARKLLADGIDPSAKRQEEKREAKQEVQRQTLTYRKAAMEWFEQRQAGNAERTKKVNLQRLERHVFPALGDKPLMDVTQENQLAVLRGLEETDKLVEAQKVLQLMRQIAAYALARGWTETKIAEGLKELMKKPRKVEKHLPAITTLDGVADMLRKIETYCKSGKSSMFVNGALKLFPYLALRGEQLLAARWEEVDFEKSVLEVPVERCQKTGKPFVVYLSRQAMIILKELYEVRRNGFIFRSGANSGHVSKEGVNIAMHFAGIPKGAMVNHGWRSVLSTLGHEYCPDYEAVELALSHELGNAVAQAYNRGQYVERRKRFAQWWADFLDALRGGAELPKWSYS